MLRDLISDNMGRSDLGWLKSFFHFSFAEYYNSDNMNFGVLRVLNDDLIKPHTGFDMHPHKDMEIVSYVVRGELTHADSMGNKRTVGRGHVQYMSAGSGVQHSEHNMGDGLLRLLQIWIMPQSNGMDPNYGDYLFEWDGRTNSWLHIVSGQDGTAPVRINQDANIYAIEFDKSTPAVFTVAPGRQAYLVQIEGTSRANGILLHERDAMEITEEDVEIITDHVSHNLLIEMKKS